MMVGQGLEKVTQNDKKTIMFRFKVVGNKVLIMKIKWKKKNEKVKKKKVWGNYYWYLTFLLLVSLLNHLFTMK